MKSSLPALLEPPPRLWAWGLGSVLCLIVVDLVLDWFGGAAAAHLVLETLSGLVIAAITAAVLNRHRAELRHLRHILSRSQEEAERWRREAQHVLRGLSEAIDHQFDRWALTPAEREVALLLLKGLSLKSVARIRGTRERTTREQARSVYRKGSLAGRSELSAFFLEDLLLPSADIEPDRFDV